MNSPKRALKTNFEISERLQKLIDRSRRLAISGKRNLYTANETQLVYHWSDAQNAIAPQSGKQQFKGLSLGDHGCRVDIGKDFEFLDEMPSVKEGYSETPESWGKDFKFLLKHSPAEIYKYETVVGEFHWEMNEVRKYKFSDRVTELGKIARSLGAGGNSHGHTCPDFSIGLSVGWGGILDKIEKNLLKYTSLENEKKRVFFWVHNILAKE